MIRCPPGSTRTYTRFPYTTRCLSQRAPEGIGAAVAGEKLRLAGQRLGAQARMLEPRARFELQPVEIELLQREQPPLPGAVLGQKGFLADHVEIAGIELRTGRARPQAAPGLGELQPAFHSLVIEGGAEIGRAHVGTPVTNA